MDKVKELEQAIENLVNKFYEETKIPIASINPRAIRLTLNGGEPKLYGYSIKIKEYEDKD